VLTIYSEQEIRALLDRDEGQFLERKSLWDRSSGQPRPLKRQTVRDFIAECVAAFANADGGDLLLGAEDDGEPTGHRYPEEAIEDFFRVAERRLRPPVAVRTQGVQIEGKDLLLIHVLPAERAVLFEGNGFPYRVGDRVVRESEEAINARKEAYRRVGYERMIRHEATLGDLDLDLARSVLAKAVRGGRTVEEALEAYGLIHRPPEGARITNAALLLFGKPPLARWHPHADIRLFRVEGKERRHGSHRNVTQLERLDLPIARIIPEAHRLARAHIRKSERLHDLFFREMPEYPEFAWQEAIVNAVAHRDYGNQALGIEVWFYEDRMEVRSPGTLVPPVTIEALRSRRPVHASRNPLIVRVLVEVGLMREEGEGIPRMYDETEAVLLKPPSFEEGDGTFAAVLFNTPIFEGVGPEWQRIVDGLPLSSSQKRILLLRPEGFTNQDYRVVNRDMDRDQAYREIQEMVSLGILVAPERAGRGARYRLAPEVLQAKRWLEARIPVLRRFLVEHESLKNADYRSLFGVPRYRAVSELRRLVEDGYLVLEGERRGARYRRGPRLGAAVRE
jgi:ATP-dependent DNA helicase RecG